MPQTAQRTVRSVCPLDCPDTCSLKVTLEGDRIVAVDGDPDHPVTQGAICNKVRNMPGRVHHPERLTYPMRRIAPKGTSGIEAFERITWEEAYEDIVRRMNAAIEECGPEAVMPYSFYGNMGYLNAEGMDRRFFHRLGATQLDRTICSVAGGVGYKYTMGAGAGIDPEDTVHSKLILVWGCNLVSTNMHQVMYATEARKRGAKIIHIDVHRNRTSTWADEFIAVRPGTDAALALGMMHVLIRDGLTDERFLEDRTVGYEELAAQAALYPPERVEEITGVPADVVVRLAREYGTVSPAYIRIGNGLQHHDNGGMAVRTIACLPALTGQWNVKGGGAIKSNGHYTGMNENRLMRPDLLANRSTRVVNMNQLGDALLQLQDPPVKFLFVYSCNPAIVTPDSNRVREGLMREDLFTVVHDLFLTDTCRYADLVLPATSHFENLDLFTSYWHLYVQLHEPILEPMGECKSNFTLFKELGLRMGFEPDVFGITEEQMIREALDNPDNPYLEGITFEKLRERGWMKAGLKGLSLFEHRIPTPSGKIELFSERMRLAGLPPVPEYSPVGGDEEELPFLLVAGPNHSFLNSTFANQEKLKKLEKQPTLHMHRDDAAALGLSSGDRVRVRNGRGEVVITLDAAENVLPGVLVTQGLWWEDGYGGEQSINALTPQRLADMGGGATFFSARVEVLPA
ncbi:molybdopterin-dependent oxidoreductase [Cohnella sp. CFH 77786]|uniref:molybdopterin-containing oxidoreductase family protein n=1 Tax=Cohnella sp. CFH 77786 TaxID=2662265 RepID=UPI001C60E7B9|nr:molybdopterin oxidoreductase family protein [Cohnella sp. CFH 77786]MBW5447497.1 molybdopterin-dependent oxidoreductase [Cohnella sp. CFH 77786]